MSDDLMDTQEAAERLNLSRERVLQFIRAERLRAKKIGQQWLISSADLERFAQEPRPVGRPRARVEGEVTE